MWLILTVVALSAEPEAPTRVDSATQVLQQLRVRFATGQAQAEDVHLWSVRVFEAERDAGLPDAAKGHLGRMRDLAKTVEKLVEDGIAPALELDAARFYVAEAEAWVGGPVEVEQTEPEPALGAAAIEACFGQCDGTFAACSTQANNFRLGVGEVTHGDAECEARAEKKCGSGRSGSRVECRDSEVRACLAGKMQATCAAEQTKCNARCR